MDMKLPLLAANPHCSLTQLWRTKENHSPNFAVCQPLSPNCPLGMQVKGTVYLKLNLLIQSKVNSISPCIQIISESDFPVCLICIMPTNWENSMCLLPFLGILSKEFQFRREHGFLYCYSPWFGQVWTMHCFWQILHLSSSPLVQY